MDSKTGILRCFSNPIETNAVENIELQGAEVRKSKCFVRDNRGSLKCFELYHPLKKWVLLIVPELGTSVTELRTAVEFCTKLRGPVKSSVGTKLKKGALAVLKSPWTATNFMIGTLEKISEGAKAADGYFTKEKKEDVTSPTEEPTKQENVKQPSNIASGLLQGAGAILKSIFSAIAGFFMEPIKGGKKNGFTGVIKGLGKGIVGLVLKPVAGTLDLVTLTARGLTNTPKTIYLKLNSVFKKKPKEPRSVIPVAPYLESAVDEDNVVPIIEDGKEYNLYLDEQELRRQLVEGFQSDEPKSPEPSNADENVKENISKVLLDEIKKRQKKQKMLKKYKVSKVKHFIKHFRESLEKACASVVEADCEKDEYIEKVMKAKERKGLEVAAGTIEMDYEGIPSPDGVPPTGAANEELDWLGNVGEFNEEENKHFSETAGDFEVRCGIVRIGIGEGGDDHELVEESDTENTSKKTLEGDTKVLSKAQSLINTTPNGKFRKNPMHRVPPSTSMCII